MTEVTDKVKKSAKNAKTFTKVELNKKGYRHLDFDTKKGNEYIGIVDLVAIKRVKNKLGQLDNLEIILFQVKGGSARISPCEKKRLKEAAKKKNVKITWNYAEKPDKQVKFGKNI